MDASTRAHADAMRKELHDLVAELGPTAVQAMTGTRDRSMPAAWARTGAAYRDAGSVALGVPGVDHAAMRNGSRVAAA